MFVAHREEILKQAAVSFQNVRNSKDYGFFMGAEKCTDKPLIFASVASLGKPEYLNEKYFAPDYFNYVIIDDYAIIGLTQESLEMQGFDKDG